MKVRNAVHEARQWEIHDIAHDFDLLDVWSLPAEGGRDDFPAFMDALSSIDPTASGSILSRLLFWVRRQLGTIIGWDAPKERRIPGSHQTSLAARVPDALRLSVLPVNTTLRMAGAAPLYRTDTEAALEISNDTVHGVLHFGWAEQDGGRYRAQMAIYIRTRGLLGAAYVKLIAPFRYLIVYPSLMREIERRWKMRA